MKQEKIADALYEQQFAVDLSIRYHDHMVNTMISLSRFFEHIFFCVVGFFVGFSFIVGILPVFTVVLVTMVIILLHLLKSSLKSIRFHTNKRTLFLILNKTIPDDFLKCSETELTLIRNKRIDIEKDDTKSFPCLDILCHNEICIARGLIESVYPLTWTQRNIGRIIPLNYRGQLPPPK
jgi:hypothetical protein